MEQQNLIYLKKLIYFTKTKQIIGAVDNVCK
jgi:hypothetical protein